MRIGVDISQTAFQGSGVARYTTLLVESMLAHDTTNEYIFFYSSLRRPISESLRKLIRKPHQLKVFRFPPTFLSLLWNTLHIARIENFIGDIDVFISSDWVQPPTKAKSITVIHDLVMFVHPETLTTSTHIKLTTLQVQANIAKTHMRRLEWVKKEVDRIIADSESTKKDIEKYLKIPAEKIQVMYPAVESHDITENKLKEVLKTHGLKRPYILSVGKLEPRKNIQRLIEAFILSHTFKTHDLVIVGSDGWGDMDMDIPTEIQETVRFLGYVSEDTLFALYKGAELFCYPSMYEGFGYPVIEAMLMGTPVLTSDASSTKELAENHGTLFDPHDTQDLVRALEYMLGDKRAAGRMAEKALPYAQSFTRKKFATKMLQVISSLA